MNMRVERVLETCLYVEDLKTAERFYSQVLGLSVFARGGNRHVFFRCGNGMFLLFNPVETVKPTESVPHGSQGSGHVAFAIPESDIARWQEHLHRSGVEIEEEVSWPEGGYSLYFRDPAGNSVELATPQVWQLA
ncbi:VOC family protein [Acidobacteria bacterium AH-259-O06]|nr:VOC family protein [Acidobacteria bacterium AH-259-O06]